MKITIVQGAFLPVPMLRGGAVEKVWFGLGKEFVKLGHEVVHISRLCDDLPEGETIDGVSHVRVPGFDTPANLILLKWRDLLFTRRVAKILPKSDIIVTNTFWAPLIFDPVRHGPLWVHVQRYPKGQMVFYRRAACLQTVSSVIARAMIRQTPGIAERVSIIPNPLPPIAVPPSPVHRDPDLILFVGRVHPEKGVALLIEAMLIVHRTNPAARLRIVGPEQERFGGGGAAFLQSMKDLAAPLGECITFPGPIFDESLLSAQFEEASTFVYPSLAGKGEASPVAPLEALARGMNVVVSDLECFDDYLEKDLPFAHRFDQSAENAPQKLAATLLPLLGNNPAHAEAAKRRAAEFSMDRIAKRYLAGFEAIA